MFRLPAHSSGKESVHITSRRIATLLTGAALATSALAIAPTPAHAEDPASPLAAAAGWLKSELASGPFGSTYDGVYYADLGATIDAGFALLASGDLAGAQHVAGLVDANLASYVGYAPEIYAGPVAKTLAFEQALGNTGAAVGGLDLVTTLEGRVTASGRITDQSGYGDYANSIGQAFAAQALTRAASSLADEATAFLIDQQCDAGWFRLYFDGTDTGCDDATDSPDTDVTAYAVLALLPQQSDPAIASAIDSAVGWLVSSQAADGSHAGGTATEASNANSTGLAAQALGEAGRTAAAAQAAAWVAGRQVLGGACDSTKLTTESGAIAYDDLALTSGRADGLDDTVGQWRLATAQAAPGLAYLPATTATLTAPAFVKAGSATTITAGGLAATERACLAGNGAATALTGNGTVTATLGAGAHTFTLSRLGKPASTTVTALAPATFAVDAGNKVRLKRRLTVVVGGLTVGEQVTVTFRGRPVASGIAAAGGIFTASFKVTRKLVKKGRSGALVKKGKLVVTGQFADRSGTATVKVKR